MLDVEIVCVDNYPANVKKLSRKNRKPCKETKRYGVLEYGHTAICLIYPISEYDELEVWWEYNDAMNGRPCDLIPVEGKGEVHLVFFEHTAFFRGKEKHQVATSVCPEVFVLPLLENLPETFSTRLKGVIVTDWDYGLDEWIV